MKTDEVAVKAIDGATYEIDFPDNAVVTDKNHKKIDHDRAEGRRRRWWSWRLATTCSTWRPSRFSLSIASGGLKSPATVGSLLQQQRALRRILGQLRRFHELHPRFIEALQLEQQIGAHAGQIRILAERRVADERLDDREALARARMPSRTRPRD